MSSPQTICGTPMTIDGVKDAVNAKLGTKATIKNWTAKEIGAGKGFVSIMAKVEIDWNESDPKLPASVIVKVPATDKLHMMDMEHMVDIMKREIYKCHNGEISVFKTLAQLEKPPAPLPFAYAFKELSGPDAMDNNELSYIIMEDLSSKADVCDLVMQKKLNDHQHEQLIKYLANIHAWSLAYPDQVKSISAINIREFWSAFAADMDESAKKFKLRSQEDQELKDLYGEHYATANVYKKITNALREGRLPNTCTEFLNAGDQHKQFGLPDTICHGDMHGNNIMLFTDKHGQPTGDICAVIDWQCVHWGNPTMDLASTMLMVDGAHRTVDAFKHVNKLYYDTFDGVMKAAGKKTPFNESQLLPALMRSFISAASFYAPMFWDFIPLVRDGITPCEDPKKAVEAMKNASKSFLSDVLSIMDYIKS